MGGVMDGCLEGVLGALGGCGGCALNSDIEDLPDRSRAPILAGGSSSSSSSSLLGRDVQPLSEEHSQIKEPSCTRVLVGIGLCVGGLVFALSMYFGHFLKSQVSGN